MAQNEWHTLALKQRIQAAIRAIRSQILWKPGKDIQHVRTRIHYGHLPPSATVAMYEAMIVTLLNDNQADVYSYTWEQEIYPTIVSTYENQRWLVMVGIDGVMETAFPPTEPDEYLADSRFQLLGKLQEIMK